MTNYRNKFQNNPTQKISTIDGLNKTKLFDLNGTKILTSQTDDTYLTEAESERFVKGYIKQKSRYIPQIDYLDPSTFSFYGSAEKYYEDSIQNIYNTYPYDGSKAEKIEWAISASYLDLYLLEHQYPKAKGHVTFERNGDAAVSSGTHYVLSNRPQYISFTGGPHINTVYNSSKNRESNLKIDGTTGNAIEFWLKKPASSWYGTTKKEVVFDIHTDDFASGSAEYGRMSVELENPSSSGASPFLFTYISGTAGAARLRLGSTTVTTASVSDNAWHHYAITTEASGSSTYYRLFVDGTLNDTSVQTHTVGAIDRAIIGTIGALAAASLGTGQIGSGKLSGSLDELRFWKKNRDQKEIGRFWYQSVHGGTGGEQGDHNNADLGLYYKFNEGITTTQSYDEVVLDYSGRAGNGKFNGWTINSRTSTSGIELSTNLPEKNFLEVSDPIVNSQSSLVSSFLKTYREKGRSYDRDNISSLANTVPSFFTDTDKELFPQLLQILASSFDDMFLKIKNLSKIKDFAYQEFFKNKGSYRKAQDNSFLLGCEDDYLIQFTGNHTKPWVDHILEHFGMVTTEIFPNASLFETFFNRTEKLTFDQDLTEVKNSILSNIHKNLVHIYKTKGTETSFRNLIRCFGVDDELIKLNAYGNNEEYTLASKPIYSSVKKKAASFEKTNFQATIHQTSTTSEELSYIPSVNNPVPFTMEANVLFPIKTGTNIQNIAKSSIFGMHSVQGSGVSAASASPLNFATQESGSFQVKFVKRNLTSSDGYFELSSSAGVITAMTSSHVPEVYDNTHWNLSVRIGAKSDIDFNIIPTGSSSTYLVEFSGYNYDLDVLKNSFHVSASISKELYRDISRQDKAVYIGAHMTNFSGSVLESSDVRVLGFNVWKDVLTEVELKEHAQNPKTFGRRKPQSISNFDDGSNLVSADSLMLRWSFENLTASNISNQLEVIDFSSGSAALVASDSITGYKYPGKGIDFIDNDGAISQNFIPSVEYAGVDNGYSSDRISIRTNDSSVFDSDSKPVTYFYNFEKSMYQVMSNEMVNFFAGIAGYNNLIGEPVNKYRDRYKAMEKLRERFFARVENDIDLDKFTEYYRWIDSSLSHFLNQLIPASSNFGSGIKDVVESHILERNKYQHRAPTVEFKDPADKTFPILGINELLYDWEHGHAPNAFNQLVNKKSISLDGTNDHVLIPDQDVFSFTDGSTDKPFSISVWVFVGDVSADDGPFVAKANFDTGANEYIFKHANGKLQMFIYDQDGSASGHYIRNLGNAATLSDTTWHHVVATYDGSKSQNGITLYTDASVSAGTKTTLGPYGRMRDTATPLTIGATEDLANANRVFEDRIADVVIFDKELSAAEVTEVYNSGRVKDMTKLSAYTNIVSWWKMGDDLDHANSGGIIDYVGGFNGTLTNGASIIDSIESDLPTDTETVTRAWDSSRGESDNCLWWSDRSERSTTNRETIRRVTVSEVSGATYVLRKLTKPYKFGVERSDTFLSGHNRKANKVTNAFTIVNQGKSITLSSADIVEQPTCNDIIIPETKETYRGKTDVTGTTGYLDLDSDQILPFTLISSSAGTDLSNFKSKLSIANNHLPLDLTGESSLKGPFAETHVGGMPHRHVAIGTANSERPEAYALTASASTMTISQTPINKPKSMFFRGVSGTRFANISNIRHTTASSFLGNYNKDYEIVQTAGRLNNNNFFVDQEGSFVSATPVQSTYVSGVIDYARPQRTRTGHVIANKFNAPGGPETMSDIGLDRVSGEFSIYNALNYRNRVARDVMDILATEYTEQFGYRLGHTAEDEAAASATIQFTSGALPQNNAKFVITSAPSPAYSVPSLALTYTFLTGAATASNQEFSGGNYQLAATNLANLMLSSNGHRADRIKVSNTVAGTISLTQYFPGDAGNITISSNANNVAISGFHSGKSVMASSHKTNRNPQRFTGSLGNEVDYDNFHVQHPIPQSAYQYSWITASVNDSVYDFLNRNDNMGYVHNFAPASGAGAYSSSKSHVGFEETRTFKPVHEQLKVSSAFLSGNPTVDNALGDMLMFNAATGSTVNASHLSFSSSSGSDLPFSFSVLVNIDHGDTYDQIILHWPGNYGLKFDNSSNRFEFHCGGSGIDISVGGYLAPPFNDGIAILSMSELERSKWYNVTCTYDGTGDVAGMKMYINGMPETVMGITMSAYDGKMSGFNALNTGAAIHEPFDYLHLGFEPATTVGIRAKAHFSIKSVLFFDKALSSTEAANVYDQKDFQPFHKESIGLYPDYGKISSYGNMVAWWNFSKKAELQTVSGSQYYGYSDLINNQILATRVGAVDPAYFVAGNFGVTNISYKSEQLFPEASYIPYSVSETAITEGTDTFQTLERAASSYGYPSWKQLRAGETPIGRYQKKNNKITISTRSGELFPSPISDYSFSTNPNEANIKDVSARSDSRVVTSYDEIMTTSRFKPITITFHRNIPTERDVREKISQRMQETLWTQDETSTLSFQSRPKDSRIISIKSTYQNDLTSFANKSLTTKLQIDDFKNHTFSDPANGTLVNLAALRRNLDNVGIELNYMETLYPKESNTFTKNARQRELFDFYGWRTARASRELVLIGSNTYGSFMVNYNNIKAFPETTIDKNNFKNTNGSFVDVTDVVSKFSPSAFSYITSSRWPLDGRKTFDSKPLDIAASYFTRGDKFYLTKDVGTRGEGVLQNDYSIFGLGYNAIHGAPPVSILYNRRIPQVSGSSVYLAGESKWDAPDQSGLVPFANSYGDHAVLLSQIGQDHSLVPEYKVSEFVEDIVTLHSGDFDKVKERSDFLSITGAIYHTSSQSLSVGQKFFKTYGTTDFMKYFGLVSEMIEDADVGSASRITLRCKAALKFTPYRGFYPAERAVQIGELFSRGYMPEFAFTDLRDTTEGSADLRQVSNISKMLEKKIRANLQQIVKPFMAPGVLMNSIKAGMAVDYPIFGADSNDTPLSNFNTAITSTEISKTSFDSSLSSLSMFTGSIVNSSHVLGGVPRLSGSVSRRITFEDILDPERIIGTKFYDNEPHQSASIYYGDGALTKVFDYPFKFGELDNTNNKNKLFADDFVLKKSLNDSLTPYKMAINNFCAETVNFFIEGGKLSSFESDQVVSPNLTKDIAYKMRITVKNNNLKMYDRHSAFGPPVDEGAGLTKQFISGTLADAPGQGSTASISAGRTAGFLVAASALTGSADGDLHGFTMTNPSGSALTIKIYNSNLISALNTSAAGFSNISTGTYGFQSSSYDIRHYGVVFASGSTSYIDLYSLEQSSSGTSARNLALNSLLETSINHHRWKNGSNIEAGYLSDGNLQIRQLITGTAGNTTITQAGGSTATPMSNYFSAFPTAFSDGINKSTTLTNVVTSTVTENNSHEYAPFVPPFLDKGADPYAEISFTPTTTRDHSLKEILAGATYTYKNFRDVPSNAAVNSNYKNAMSLSASLDLSNFSIYREDEAQAGVTTLEQRKRWVIQTKWETPVLNFINTSASALNLSSSQVDSVPNSPWQSRVWNQYLTKSVIGNTVPYITSSTGMWHQYGSQLQSDQEGYTISIAPVPGITQDQQLARKVGFLPENLEPVSITPGKIAQKKEISEAVVAIPFYYKSPETETSQQAPRFFTMRDDQLQPAIDLNTGMRNSYLEAIRGKNRDESSSGFEVEKEKYLGFYNTPGQAPQEVLAYQLRMMEKYVFPPQFDFMSYPEMRQKPMMYIFQFNAELTKDDLSNIWQNLSPQSVKSTAKARNSGIDTNVSRFGVREDVQYVSHLFNERDIPVEERGGFLNKNVRWVLFKVKQRAEIDLANVKINSLPGARRNLEIDSAVSSLKKSDYLKDKKYSYNWPYDYFSLVELIKLEGKVDFLPFG